MDLHDIVTLLHVVTGGLGLVLAWPVLFAPKRRGLHTTLGRVFAGAAAVVCATTLVLFARDPGGLVGFGILGLLTALWAGGGVWLARVRPRVPGGWLRWHLRFMGSAVIAFVTAFAVQLTDGSLVAWIAPSIGGGWLIGRRSARIASPQRKAAVPVGPAS